MMPGMTKPPLGFRTQLLLLLTGIGFGLGSAQRAVSRTESVVTPSNWHAEVSARVPARQVPHHVSPEHFGMPP